MRREQRDQHQTSERDECNCQNSTTTWKPWLPSGNRFGCVRWGTRSGIRHKKTLSTGLESDKRWRRLFTEKGRRHASLMRKFLPALPGRYALTHIPIQQTSRGSCTESSQAGPMTLPMRERTCLDQQIQFFQPENRVVPERKLRENACDKLIVTARPCRWASWFDMPQNIVRLQNGWSFKYIGILLQWQGFFHFASEASD